MNAHAQPVGSNRIPDDREVLLRHHLAKLESIDERMQAIREEWKAARKEAVADGFALRDEIDLGMRIRTADKREMISASLRRQLQTAAYLGLPVNFQMDMFAGAAASDDAIATAFESGLTAGIEGLNPQSPEQFAAGDLNQAWMDGWHKGQERLREAMQRRMEAANAESEAKQSGEPKKRGRPPGSKNRKKDEAAENTSGTGADPFATKH